jgi:hypothetical protein
MWGLVLLAAVPFADLPTFSVDAEPDFPAVEEAVDVASVFAARCTPRILRPWVSNVMVTQVPGHQFEVKLFANESIRAAVRFTANHDRTMRDRPATLFLQLRRTFAPIAHADIEEQLVAGYHPHLLESR